MEQTGMCMICEKRPANKTCPSCGKLICEEHTTNAGICTGCSRKMS